MCAAVTCAQAVASRYQRQPVVWPQGVAEGCCVEVERRNDAQLWGAACFTDEKKRSEKQISFLPSGVLLAVRCDRRLANTMMRDERSSIGNVAGQNIGGHAKLWEWLPLKVPLPLS